MKTITINGHTREIQSPQLSDMEVASRVRMLLRSNLDHESVCTLARDRIVWLANEVERLTKLVSNIQGALGTEETGDALVEVARNACRAEQELAALHREYDDEDHDDGLRGTGERGS